jgi:hypothetical protein
VAPELHHGFTTQGQPWRLGHGLSHLLGNSRTRGGHRLPPGASPSSRRLSDEWMEWRLAEAEAINRQAPRAKGGAKPGQEWAGPVSPGPFRPGSVLVSSPIAFCMIPNLCAFACGPLTSFPSRLRLESMLCKLHCFLVESLKTCTLTLRSLGHLESCSSRVLTLVGLHDLLPKCLVNLSRKSPL